MKKFEGFVMEHDGGRYDLEFEAEGFYLKEDGCTRFFNLDKDGNKEVVCFYPTNKLVILGIENIDQEEAEEEETHDNRNGKNYVFKEGTGH